MIESGRELNVKVEPNPFIYASPISKRDHIDVIENNLKTYFAKQKSLDPPIELIVVIFPEYPSGIYGK